MGRKFQRLAIFISIFVVLGAYLSYVPNSEGVEQMGRIRLLTASMRISRFVVSIIIFFRTFPHLFDLLRVLYLKHWVLPLDGIFNEIVESY
jgi:hypothetical protein